MRYKKNKFQIQKHKIQCIVLNPLNVYQNFYKILVTQIVFFLVLTWRMSKNLGKAPSQGRRLRACGHATHARTFDYTQHMEVRYKLESVEKQHKQARVYINGPQTLIKRSPEVMGCSPKCWSPKKKVIASLTATRHACRNFWRLSAITLQTFSRKFRRPTSETRRSHCGTKSLHGPYVWHPCHRQSNGNVLILTS